MDHTSKKYPPTIALWDLMYSKKYRWFRIRRAVVGLLPAVIFLSVLVGVFAMGRCSERCGSPKIEKQR